MKIFYCRKGSITLVGAFAVATIGFILMALIIEMSIIIMAKRTLSLVAESAAHRGAGTAVIKTAQVSTGVAHPVYGEEYETYYYLEIEDAHLAEQKAREIIAEYGSMGVFEYIVLLEEEFSFERLPTQDPVLISNNISAYDRYRVALSGRVRRFFSGFWSDIGAKITVSAEAGSRIKKAV